ncbi:MAG: aldehyde ferredoxin oxidoreductase family protein [Chloroflexi bacterium]|nr:aldehyde ferredoxin oxidoreductase family protein [Chloroflexota bacterium]
MFGFAGKLLRVNLSTSEVAQETLSEEMARKYLGGRGFAARILYDELAPGIDPLGPDNKIVYATGVLTGTPAPVGNRTVVASKSPLTGIWGDAAFGGWFGGELKKAGFDAVIVEGASAKPVYLWISDGQAEIRDASHLWGQETGPAQEALLGEVGQAKVLCIGPGGENLVRYASVLSELRFSASRAGIGAVMGAKRLKAIAVRGSGHVEVAEREKLIALARQINKQIKADASCGTLTRYGTWNNLTPLQHYGILPTKNFQTGVIQGGERLESEAMVEAILSDRESCPNCPIFCRRVVKMEKPYQLSGIYGGPQYETVAALGSLLLNTDPQTIAKAHELCNRYGIDTISTGVCIAWAMECWERGIDLGRPLPWGDAETIFTLIEEIAYRRGVGAILADGIRTAAARVGQGSEAWALHLKGLELPMHDPRGKKGMGLAYATTNRGGCHMQTIHEDALTIGGPFPELGLDTAMSRTQLEGKAYLIKITQDYFGTLGDTLGICKFPMNAWRPYTPTRVAQAVALVTGWDITLEELLTAGERIYNLCRMFNVREGIRRADDTVPARLGEPLPEGASAGESFSAEDLAKLLAEYYMLRGWDENGIPKPETLARLGLQ